MTDVYLVQTETANFSATSNLKRLVLNLCKARISHPYFYGPWVNIFSKSPSIALHTSIAFCKYSFSTCCSCNFSHPILNLVNQSSGAGSGPGLSLAPRYFWSTHSWGPVICKLCSGAFGSDADLCRHLLVKWAGPLRGQWYWWSSSGWDLTQLLVEEGWRRALLKPPQPELSCSLNPALLFWPSEPLLRQQIASDRTWALLQEGCGETSGGAC